MPYKTRRDEHKTRKQLFPPSGNKKSVSFGKIGFSFGKSLIVLTEKRDLLNSQNAFFQAKNLVKSEGKEENSTERTVSKKVAQCRKSRTSLAQLRKLSDVNLKTETVLLNRKFLKRKIEKNTKNFFGTLFAKRFVSSKKRF